LATYETQEVRKGSQWRRELLANLRPDEFEQAARASNPLRKEVWSATTNRVQAEFELNHHAKLPPQPIPDRLKPQHATPEEGLSANNLRHDRAAEAWFKWRDEHSPGEVLAARRGDSEGAKLCHEFRCTRAWVLEAAKELHMHRQFEKNVPNAPGL